MKIIVAEPLNLLDDQWERLNKLGEVIRYDSLASSVGEWMERVKDADVICSGKFGLKQKVNELKNVFISVPYVGISWADQNKLKENNVILKKSPGCNKEAVSEYIIGMMIGMLRRLPQTINAEKIEDVTATKSIAGKKVLVCGAGNIGTRVGEICEVLHANVDYFRRGDNLLEKAKDADIIVDTLSGNEDSYGMYDEEFFSSLKKGSYFLTVTSSKIWDADALISALDKCILAGAVTDCGNIQVDNTADPLYRKLSKHPKIFATAHIAYNNDSRQRVCNDMMIDNIEEYAKSNNK